MRFAIASKKPKKLVTNVRLKKCRNQNDKHTKNVPCTIGSANFTAFLPSAIGCAIIGAMPAGKARQLA